MLGSSISMGAANTLSSTEAKDVLDNILLTIGTDGDGAILNRSTTLTANTALTSVLIGTPVAQALAANSLIIANTTADGDILIAGNDGGHSRTALFFDSSANMAHLYALTLNGAVAGGDQAFTNVGDMTFAAGSILASDSTNTDTLILRANDTAFITFTTGATDECEIEAATMKGTWLADGTVTMPALTLGDTLNANGNVISNFHQINSLDSAYTVIRRDGGAGIIFDMKGSGGNSVNAYGITGGSSVNRMAMGAGAVFNVGSAVHGTPVEGDMRILTNKLNVYLDGAWEVVTSA
tara:strand:- start:159 stop:1043 length:885 start_codon:yes stop_codon:yes gene_type:complete